MRSRTLLLLAAVPLIVGVFACSGGLPLPVGVQATVPGNDNPGIGLFLGVQPSAAISGLALTGAGIPNTTGGHNPLMFVAFVTSAAADDADGELDTTDPIDLTRSGGMATPPDDTNGSQDVFLAAIVPSAGDASGAFNLRIFEVTQHPRCISCHGQNYPGPCDPGSSHPNHSLQSQTPCVQQGCIDCHTESVTGFELDLDGEPWRSPPFCDEPSCTNFDFRNRTPVDLCQSIANRLRGDAEAVREHMISDPFIVWAITSSRVPTTPATVAQGGRVPIDFSTTWVDAVDAWTDGFGLNPDDPFNCVSLGSRRDIVLVSQVQAGGAAGNSSARRPSVTFVPNPAFQVGEPGAASAGTVFVAYDSDATDLVAGDTNGVSDVFRTSIEVWVDAAFVAGDPTSAAVDLRFVPGQNVRVSLRDQSLTQGSGRATNASIAPGGDRIAFVSEDTNIADPSGNGIFDDDTNGVTDVFVRQIGTNRTQLVSTDATGLSPGNGASSSPVMSANSTRGLAFESLATDLVALDTNGVQDVFYVLLGSDSIAEPRLVARASDAGGGAQAAGGDSSAPSIHVIDADSSDVLVGFESAKTNLVAALPPNSSVQAFLFESATNRTTLLNQKLLPLPTMGSAQGGAAPADSRRVRIAPDGSYVYFESLADNIDVIRPVDGNASSDVFRVDLGSLLGSGRVRPERISITRDGQTADAASTGVLVGAFRQPGTAQDGGPLFGGSPILFESQASNLPTDASNDAVLVFTP